jgi:hypothetical protein
MSWTAASDVPSGTWVVIVTRYSIVNPPRLASADVADDVMKL